MPTKPRRYNKGDKVRSIHTQEEFIVKDCFWQPYAGPDTADYTVIFEQKIQPTPGYNVSTPWNKSRNLVPVE